MPDPVKLSAERWSLLAGSFTMTELRVLSDNGFKPMRENSIVLSIPRETHGIVFLPAEYVPSDVVMREKKITLAVGGAH